VAGVAVVGNLSVDTIDGAPPRPGGGPYHAARALRALNRPALVVAACAAADRPLVLPPLVRLGVPVLWREAPATARFGIEYHGDERRMTVEAVGSPWRAEDVTRWTALRRVQWVHLAPLVRSDFPVQTVAAFAEGRRLSYDGQGLVRPAHTGPLEPDAEFDRELLAHISILKLAEEEALTVAGGLTEQALRTLGTPEVVVTLGRRGSIVFADGVAEHVAIRPVAPRTDVTGAGDAFAAAYLLARSGGFSPSAAARWASGAVAGLLSGHVR
jgi:sugar/nucleoside kinase (ribokinase family)